VDTSGASFFFHQPRFVFRNPEVSIVTFEEANVKIYFSHTGNSLVSLERSPFGGFALSRKATKHDLVSTLVKMQEWSHIHHINNVMIRSFPEIYAPDQSEMIKEVLIESGFIIKYQDISQVIPVTSAAMTLNADKKRRLRKAEIGGFNFRKLPMDFLKEGYQLIVQSRENKGYPITLTLHQLEDVFQSFPDHYLLFGLFDKEKMIASSVSIKVNEDILYCFYLGDDLLYRSDSPVTALVHGIYHFCQTNNYNILDLGISTDKGVLNQGLYDFKKTFGCIDAYKLTFLKQF
jgi:hypothetical protein